ncbi:SigE family RNA polymerase sigma factor [Sphaerisporangium sp. TRM90804]|uniref:SigE family RNA polymerase sigma factor n=1 Tax=Sphaerisporangium sp. TRM90804 TaxID=3031113 RepID=UPI00244D42CD|nr:SigE family RNA polymerase sigma factor [Sphaerisporangium sp. TRM90804]MDH2430880.1 SigE family RNA polymerase sigma factor [Sphaerisporangium sp. TRM90804]
MDADFADFVRHRGEHHLRTAVLLTGNWHTAEDLMQSCLGKLYRAWPRLDTSTEPDAYLRRILVNTHRSWWRARWRREIPRAEMPNLPGPGELAEALAVAEDVRNALAKLPARQRTALVLRFFADLPEQEVADLMGCSAGTVKTHTHRGLRAMRRLIPPDTLVNRTEEEGSGIR